MVKFRNTMGGYEVRVDDQSFGHIDKDGFFTDPTVVKNFMRVSPCDLREIADKTESHKIDLSLMRLNISNSKARVAVDKTDSHHKGCSVTATAYK